MPRHCRYPAAVAIALVLYGQADHAHVMKVTAVQMPSIRARDARFYQQTRLIHALPVPWLPRRGHQPRVGGILAVRTLRHGCAGTTRSSDSAAPNRPAAVDSRIAAAIGGCESVIDLTGWS